MNSRSAAALPGTLGARRTGQTLSQEGQLLTQRKRLLTLLTVIFALHALASVASASGPFEPRRLLAEVGQDYRDLYLDGGSMARLGAGLLAAGVLANGPHDADFRDFFQGRLRGGFTDAASDIASVPGDAFVAVPALLAAYALVGEGALRNWAGNSLRAILVGAPAGLLLQYSTGGARPEEGGSGWRPLSNNNGLSGHAFIGAAPLLTAARAEPDRRLKALYYGLSLLPALSRVNDEKHYLSQVALGWWLAYLSTGVVEGRGRAWSVGPAPVGGGAGVMVFARF